MMYKDVVIVLACGLVFGSVSAATQSFGRVVDSGFYDLISQDTNGFYCVQASADEESRNVFYVEITNVTDVATCVPSIVYGTAGDTDVMLGSPSIVTTAQIKQQIWDDIQYYWDQNGAYWTWDPQTYEMKVMPIQDAFETVEDYAYMCSPSLDSDEDFFYELDSSSVTGRCWAVIVIGYSNRFSDSVRSFSLKLDDSAAHPIAFKVFGSRTNYDTIPNVRDGGICEYGYISPEYASKTLGVDFLWVSNSYKAAQITPPCIGGADYGKIYLCFGGSNSLEIAFNAPCAGAYILDGDFPYDYSYRLWNSSLDWTTDTPGAVVHNMRPAVSTGASGARAFTHLYQVQLEVDRPGPCVLKSPIANNVVYAAIPHQAGKPAVSYPGQLSTADDGTRFGWTTVSIRFAPANTNYLFVGTTAFDEGGSVARGRVTPSKCWLQGEVVKIQATPYDDYEFDYWECPEGIAIPAGLDIHNPNIEFVADATMCGDRSDNRRICLKSHFKVAKVLSVPSGYLDALIEKGSFPDVTNAADLKNALAKNGRLTVGECYVCGVDPESETQEFTSKIELVGGEPIITWEPELAAAAMMLRKYTIWGSVDLGEWVVVDDSTKGNYNFFKVTVEMK